MSGQILPSGGGKSYSSSGSCESFKSLSSIVTFVSGMLTSTEVLCIFGVWNSMSFTSICARSAAFIIARSMSSCESIECSPVSSSTTSCGVM
nr:MAG TPA: hypothetical protein [Caudoviricetes sp.]